MSKNSCQELNNIKYKTMLIQGNLSIDSPKNNLNIDEILEKDSILSKMEPWCKLNKTNKLLKLQIYSETLISKYSLTDIELSELQKYLEQNLDKKNLLKIKDVVYDKDSGIIKNIPNLLFNNVSRKFYLKKNEKHISTIKSLAPKKTRKVSKNLQELEKLDITDTI